MYHCRVSIRNEGVHSSVADGRNSLISLPGVTWLDFTCLRRFNPFSSNDAPFRCGVEVDDGVHGDGVSPARGRAWSGYESGSSLGLPLMRRRYVIGSYG